MTRRPFGIYGRRKILHDRVGIGPIDGDLRDLPTHLLARHPRFLPELHRMQLMID